MVKVRVSLSDSGGRASIATTALADQGFSSVSNLAATLFVANVATPAGFGSFGLLMAVYLLSVTLCKGLVGAIVGLEVSRERGAALRAGASDALSAALAVGVAIGLAMVLTSLAVRGTTRELFLCGGLLMPVLLAQDTARQVCYALGRPGLAALSSLVWLGFQVGAFAVLAASSQAGTFSLSVAWMAACVPALVLPMAVAGLTVSPARSVDWFRQYSSSAMALGLDYLLIASVSNAAPLVVAGISGVSAVGAMRGAITMFGPLTMVMHGLTMALLPRAARRAQEGDPRFYTGLLSLGLALGSCSIILGLILTLAPDEFGRSLLGESWQASQSLCLLTGLWLGLGYLTEPAINSLRLARKSSRVTACRCVIAPVAILFCAAGADMKGAMGALSGLSLISLAALCVFWGVFFVERPKLASTGSGR